MWTEGRSCKALPQVTHAGLQFRRIYKPLLERVYGSPGTGGGGRNVHWTIKKFGLQGKIKTRPSFYRVKKLAPPRVRVEGGGVDSFL